LARTATGAPFTLDSFLFAVAERLALPGFGEQCLSDVQGNPCALKTAEDFYLRGLANMAFAGGKAVPPASDDDQQVTGADRFQPVLQARLKDDEWRQAAMLMTRGGRFDTIESAWKGEHIRKPHTEPLQLWNEQVAKMRHTMTGERLSGCPTWYPTRLADGSAMRDHFPEEQWPMLMTSYKSNLMSSMSIGIPRLRQVHPHNPVSVNREDAARLGIRNGDTVRLTTPGNSMLAVALVRDGMMRGAIAIEYGYGHTELGAREHTVDGKAQPHNPEHANGVNLNDLGFADPSRGEHRNIWVDWVSGAAVRQGLPVRIERV
jgi:tetrathionate reductase subunit A